MEVWSGLGQAGGAAANYPYIHKWPGRDANLERGRPQWRYVDFFWFRKNQSLHLSW